ncbi:TolC family protein [Candidatus Sumerlaeota bacterium]|nr:TolC family protein [Candidatus Sumerlaeota bacterium]
MLNYLKSDRDSYTSNMSNTSNMFYSCVHPSSLILHPSAFLIAAVASLAFACANSRAPVRFDEKNPALTLPGGSGQWRAPIAKQQHVAPQHTSGSLPVAPATSPLATAATSFPLASDILTSRGVGELIYQIVVATEEHDPRLAAHDSQVRQLEAEIKDLRFSVGWEIEVAGRHVDFDATRHAVREPGQLDLYGRERRPYDLRGPYDREDSELIVRLKRSFLGPDHEKYVKIAERTIDLMDEEIRKQEARRSAHLATIETVSKILYAQAILPVLDERVALVRQQIEILLALQKAGAALRKDLLEADKQLKTLEEQRLIYDNSIRLGLNELRQKTGWPTLTLPAILLVGSTSPAPPRAFNEHEATSQALNNRLDYHIARERVRLANEMAAYMAWYLPRVDFEVGWNDYLERRHFLESRRRESGTQFSAELSLTYQLASPYRSWKRRQAFRARQEGLQREMDQMRATFTNQVLRAHLDWQLACLHHGVTSASLAQALEEARQTDLLAQRLPGEIEGIAEVKQMESKSKATGERIALLEAERDLLLAQARWEYMMGNSPVDEATAIYEERDRRAAQRKSWLSWWTNLTNW